MILCEIITQRCCRRLFFFNIYICVCKKMPLHCKCVGTDYQRCEFGSSWNALISTCLLKSKLCLWRAQEFLRITIWITITRLSTHRDTRTWLTKSRNGHLSSKATRTFCQALLIQGWSSQNQLCDFKQNHRKPQYCLRSVWWGLMAEAPWVNLRMHPSPHEP